ncbi:MAG: permease [Candidatus Aerophobetes bacterium]|nr:permease [Candidatus Aerophobetes bacterium]
MIIKFVLVLEHYLIEVLPVLAIGFFLSGLIHEFVPGGWIGRYLGRKGIKPVAYATLAGIILPICCLGSLPVAVSFYKKGAKLGPVLAFLVATPATSITALLVTCRLLGLEFTIFLFFSVILIGLIMGITGNLIEFRVKNPGLLSFYQKEAKELITDPVCGMSVKDEETTPEMKYKDRIYYFCSPHCKTTFQVNPAKYVERGKHKRGLKERIKSLFKYAFVDMVKEIGPELLLGLILAALIKTVVPIGILVKQYLAGGWGYLFSLVFSLIMYICSTASFPLVDAFLNQGMNIGAGMVLLLLEPVTSYGTILILRKEFGDRILLIYLGVISILSLAAGYCFSII